MKIKIGVFTGARSDYGVTKKLIKNLNDDKIFDVKIFVSGMHLLKKYGNTFNEITDDGFLIYKKINTYQEVAKDKRNEFSETLNKVFESVKNEKLHAGYIVGDRIEAYGVALALHFLNIPVIHYAGGQITKGAVDNIYRYNISNLAYLHFTTIKTAYQRLINLPTLNSENVYFTGSTAIDSIQDFLIKPINISTLIPDLHDDNYVLMTFHPVTNSEEVIEDIMEYSINKILNLKLKILITFPNNDTGADKIISVIENFKSDKNVIVKKNLGTVGYYSAINNSKFVIGNSSSGVIEVPYFNKISINIGRRQDGRDLDQNVWSIKSDTKELNSLIERGNLINWRTLGNNSLYGSGNSIQLINGILKKKFQNILNN